MEKNLEETLDEQDASVADEAYAEYIESGCKSRPIGELWKECGLNDMKIGG